MKKRLSIPIEADLHTALKLAAAREQTSIAALVNAAILPILNHRREPPLRAQMESRPLVTR